MVGHENVTSFTVIQLQSAILLDLLIMLGGNRKYRVQFKPVYASISFHAEMYCCASHFQS